MKPLGHFIFACCLVALGSGCRPPGIPFVNGPSISPYGISGPSISTPRPPSPPSIPGPPGMPQPPSPW